MILDHPLRGRSARLATLHGKEADVAPPFLEILGMDVRAVALDTDALGTFAGEVPRSHGPLETAIIKARMAIEATGVDVGLGSEGTIGPHPDVPFMTCDTETLACVLVDLDIVVHETATEIGVPAHGFDVSGQDVSLKDLERVGFPSHGVIVRPSGSFDPIFKGLHDQQSLDNAVRSARACSADGTVRVESDFRAHHHPVRRTVIARAARSLAARLARTCPDCGSPGWGRSEVLAGAPCSYCAAPTGLAMAEIHGCPACEARRVVPLVAAEGVDARHCPWCNP